MDPATEALVLRSRVYSYGLGGLVLAAGGILQNPRGWFVVGLFLAWASYSLLRLIRPGKFRMWSLYLHMLIPPLTAVVVGLNPYSMHLLVVAQVGGTLLAPRTVVTTTLAWTGAIGIVGGLLAADIDPLVPLPADGYARAELGAILLGLALGTQLIVVLLQRHWDNQHQLSAYAEKERRSAELQKQLVSVVSHELRTPLAAILGFSDVLNGTSELSDQDRAEFAAAVNDEAQHLSRLVDDLVDHLKLDLDRLSVERRPTDVCDVLRRLVLGNEAQGRVIDGADIPESVFVSADPDRLYQVIRNLIDNAHKYGGDQIGVGITCLDMAAEIWVSDNGPGLPPGRAEEMFAEYAQVESGRGLGLGLSIARRLTRAMGGDLRYDGSTPGARFIVSLPLLSPEAKPALAPRAEPLPDVRSA